MTARTIAIIALAPLASAAAAQAPAPPEAASPRQVTVVLAHPDDELPMAPALAALARTGHRVRIVHATPGDAGPGVSGLEPGEALAAVRRAEADCAGRALGAAEVVNLGFGDGALADQMQGTLQAGVRDYVTASGLVLTWGPDGGYGHADHRLVSALATQIVQALPAAARPRLLYVGIPAGRLAAAPPLANWAETDPALLTEAIAYTPVDLAAAATAAQCHKTQFDDATRSGMMGLFDAAIWRGAVHFRAAF
jgi:LmbE family N-acetylglucosaminyl deacetylase